MKKALQLQYKAILATIQSNVDTVKQLIKQAQNLRELVGSLGSGAENEEVKKKLEKEIDAVEKSIGALIDHTETLFNSYDLFVDNNFAE